MVWADKYGENLFSPLHSKVLRLIMNFHSSRCSHTPNVVRSVRAARRVKEIEQQFGKEWGI
jgi:hypothetical protein